MPDTPTANPNRGERNTSEPCETPPSSGRRVPRPTRLQGSTGRRREHLIRPDPELYYDQNGRPLHGTVQGVLVFLPDGTLRADIRPVITTYERLSPSSKHRKFVSERMRDKHVSSVAGIAHEYSDALVDLGFDKAYILFGQFLIYKKERSAFIEWLVDTIGISVKNATMAYDCLNEWSEKFL